MTSHKKTEAVHGDFCGIHLRYLVSCSDADIASALAAIPEYDLNRLRKIVARPVKTAPAPAEKEAS